jgi:type III restriction enzyme
MSELAVHDDLIAEIAARLDLRDPNRDAVRTIDLAVSQHFDVDGEPPPFEAVVDSATGVGKTYILTGAMELFVAAHGVRDFVIVTPGRTILDKTCDNFTPGHPKSLLGPMSFRPVVITADNFATPAIRAAMDDPSQVKIYLFTVQSLIKPDSKQGRKTHKFQEGLGTEFYAHLQHAAKMVVFADEHHCYYGASFSKAVRDINPWVLIGLTATPHKQTPEDQIIFRYPLAAAIADRLVKTPVIVGRKDDRTDDLTKLTDGVTLLTAKSNAVAAYVAATGSAGVNPVMLVVAKIIEDAKSHVELLRSNEFFGGRFANAVLEIHSDSPDEALAALAKVEDDESPVRIIVSVGMLKEGWDVRNVYVIASMRPSISDILTEQTLGRGMRLPFGAYTGIEILDTLEVIAHERYGELLKKRGVLNEAFVDYRTWAALRTNAQGQTVVVTESTTSSVVPLIPENEDAAPTPYAREDGEAAPLVMSISDRAAQVASGATALKRPVVAREGVPALLIPIMRMGTVQASFSLADIGDRDPFRKLGAALAANPSDELSRTIMSAHIVTGPDGIRRTEMVRSTAADHIRSTPSLFAEQDLRTHLAEIVLASPAVPARANERTALSPLLDAFFEGLGGKAADVLSAHLDRAGARLVALVGEQQRRFMHAPTHEDVVEVRRFEPLRSTDKPVSGDRLGPFTKSVAYEGWRHSMFDVAWFDSEPERHVANIVDEDDGVALWVRLHINDLPLLWNAEGQHYNPDLIVVESAGTHWVLEVKMDKEMQSADVLAKREQAVRWANHANADPQVDAQWAYLLVSETDVTAAKDSWTALKALGT